MAADLKFGIILCDDFRYDIFPVPAAFRRKVSHKVDKTCFVINFSALSSRVSLLASCCISINLASLPNRATSSREFLHFHCSSHSHWARFAEPDFVISACRTGFSPYQKLSRNYLLLNFVSLPFHASFHLLSSAVSLQKHQSLELSPGRRCLIFIRVGSLSFLPPELSKLLFLHRDFLSSSFTLPPSCLSALRQLPYIPGPNKS